MIEFTYMYWIFFAILAPALYAVTNFFDKFLIEKRVYGGLMERSSGPNGREIKRRILRLQADDRSAKRYFYFLVDVLCHKRWRRGGRHDIEA